MKQKNDLLDMMYRFNNSELDIREVVSLINMLIVDNGRLEKELESKPDPVRMVGKTYTMYINIGLFSHKDKEDKVHHTIYKNKNEAIRTAGKYVDENTYYKVAHKIEIPYEVEE